MAKKTKIPRFTFKKDNSTGRFASFNRSDTQIKFKGIWCGSIGLDFGHKVRFMVSKIDGIPVNDSCGWRWITLKHESQTEDEARQWLQDNAVKIFERYEIKLLNDD